MDLHAGWDADIISGASVDVRSSASPRAYTEVRQGITLGSTWRARAGSSIGVRWTPSWEPDYESEIFSASTSHEMFDRRLEASIGIRGAFDRVGRVGSARSTWRALDVGGIDAGLGLVFGPRTVGHVALEAQFARVYQSSPYRFVRISGFAVTESVPESRARFAVAVGLRQALSRRVFTAGSFRFYDDAWEIASHTEEIELAWASPRDRFVAGASVRTYGQSAASFYRGSYAFTSGGIPLYRTADKLLAPQLSVLAGLRVSYAWLDLGIFKELRATIKLELYAQRFFDFAPLEGRAAAIVSGGIAETL